VPLPCPRFGGIVICMRFYVACLALFAGLLGTHATHGADSAPNIVFIMADDQGYGDVACYGSRHLLTPNIDQLAREGMRFSHCYSGSAVCAPSRCVLMTGLHPGHCTRRDNTATGALGSFAGRPLVPLAATDSTIASILKQRGYATGGFGKWGLGNPGTTGTPDKHGFDLFFGYLDQVHAHDYYTDHLVKNGGEKIPLKKGTYSHIPIFDAALQFIRDSGDKPFFCYLPVCLPHGKYVTPTDKAYSDKPWSQTVKNYAAMITHLDSDVGRLMKLLKELEIDKQTIVFYTSDNGPNPPFVKPLESAGPFRGVKRQLTEGGLRAPMIVRWPGKISAGTESDFVWGHVDFFATACALAGINHDNKDSISVVPTLLGEKQQPRPPLYWEIHHPFQQAVRTGRWKAIRHGTKSPLQLYDVLADPKESVNLASDNPAVVKSIETIMDREHSPSRFYPALEKPRGKKAGRKNPRKKQAS
jgi:arylsulfatase A-like enzyme